jgi:hypothetical protein
MDATFNESCYSAVYGTVNDTIGSCSALPSLLLIKIIPLNGGTAVMNVTLKLPVIAVFNVSGDYCYAECRDSEVYNV